MDEIAAFSNCDFFNDSFLIENEKINAIKRAVSTIPTTSPLFRVVIVLYQTNQLHDFDLVDSQNAEQVGEMIYLFQKNDPNSKLVQLSNSIIASANEADDQGLCSDDKNYSKLFISEEKDLIELEPLSLSTFELPLINSMKKKTKNVGLKNDGFHHNNSIDYTLVYDIRHLIKKKHATIQVSVSRNIILEIELIRLCKYIFKYQSLFAFDRLLFNGIKFPAFPIKSFLRAEMRR